MFLASVGQRERNTFEIVLVVAKGYKNVCTTFPRRHGLVPGALHVEVLSSTVERVNLTIIALIKTELFVLAFQKRFSIDPAA